ncbi:MAG: hypothetical protein V1495_08390 [Pseudomonadota bacterium]
MYPSDSWFVGFANQSPYGLYDALDPGTGVASLFVSRLTDPW